MKGFSAHRFLGDVCAVDRHNDRLDLRVHAYGRKPSSQVYVQIEEYDRNVAVVIQTCLSLCRCMDRLSAFV